MRTSWEIQQAVIKALLIRELKTRFGNSALGYAWAIIGPFLQIMILVVIFTTISRNGYQGLPFALFFAPGMLQLSYFTSMANSGGGTIKGNKGLFNYRQVKPFDAFLTRTLIEFTLLIVTFTVIYTAFYWYGYDITMNEPLTVITILLCLCTMGFGIAIFFGSISLYFKDIEKIIPLLTRPLFFISCVIYPLIIIPSEYRYLFLWNPLVHAIELMRAAWYPHYLAPGADLMYLFKSALLCSFLGMLFYRRNWRQMVAS